MARPPKYHHPTRHIIESPPPARPARGHTRSPEPAIPLTKEPTIAAAPQLAPTLRKPPQSEQFNWITGRFEIHPEQLPLDLPPHDPDPITLPNDPSVLLLATENGAQLLIAGFGFFLGKKSERVIVKKDREVCAQVPMLRLQEIVVASRGVSLSSDLIEELCSRGIRIAFQTSAGKPVALLTSPLLTATVETRRAQLEAFHTERGAAICRSIVAGKLRNQEKLLRYFGKSRQGEALSSIAATAASIRRLRAQANSVTGESTAAVRPTLMALEGAAGRLYWNEIRNIIPRDSGFQSRDHRPANDPVNAALNYGYGILYSHVWGATLNAGLEPFAGLLHVDRSGKPSLVLDLVEEFRQPVVDRAIFTWLNRGGKLSIEKGMLDQESKEQVASRVLARLNTVEEHRRKKHEVRSIIQMQARLAASALRGIRDYRPFAFRW